MESSDRSNLSRRRLLRRRSAADSSQSSANQLRRPVVGNSGRSPSGSNVIQPKQWQRHRGDASLRPRAPRPADTNRVRPQRLLPGRLPSEANLPASRSRSDLMHQPPRRRVRMGPDPHGNVPISRTAAFSSRSPQSRYSGVGSGTGLSRIPPHEQVLPVLPSRRADSLARYERPVKRLNPRPIAAKTRSRPKRKARKSKQPASPLVYATRLLILGVGVGAIAGTLISVFDPAARYGGGAANSTLADTASETTSEMASGSSMTGTLLNAPRSGRSLLANLQLGRELTSLASVIRTDAFAAPELTPGLFLVDLDDRSYVNLNGNQRFAAASMIKVPVLVAFFQDVDAGKIQLNDVFTMQEEDVASGSGDMQFHDVGTEYSAIEVATLMITISDNTATNILIREMGGIEALNRRFQSWGFAETRLNSVLPDLEGTNTTTPQELVELMVLVSQGELISLRSRDRLLEIMRGTVTNTLLPAGIAPEATIAHKTGDIGSLVGDVGVVDMPNGKRYAIAAMVQRPHNDDRAQELIRQMSRTVYDYLENPRQFQLSNSDSSSQLNSVTDDLDPEINPESSYEDGL